jgi:soluble lytic murein transglycosylase-like protein
MSAARWRALIQRVVRDVWPQLKDGAAWIEAQVQTESAGRSEAVSSVGASGLLQLMPETAEDVGVVDLLDPEQNLRGGVRYLRQQHEHMPEIPVEPDRLFWSFASYNAGRGYINRALALARMDNDQLWWKWDVGSHWLKDPRCVVNGRHPDYQQVWDYVRRIRTAKAHPAELES